MKILSSWREKSWLLVRYESFFLFLTTNFNLYNLLIQNSESIWISFCGPSFLYSMSTTDRRFPVCSSFFFWVGFMCWRSVHYWLWLDFEDWINHLAHRLGFLGKTLILRWNSTWRRTKQRGRGMSVFNFPPFLLVLSDKHLKKKKIWIASNSCCGQRLGGGCGVVVAKWTQK